MKNSFIAFIAGAAFACTLSGWSAAQTEETAETVESAGQAQLARFLGTWEGESADGRFRERTRYRWGPGRKHLTLDMRFFVDDQPSGEGSGFMIWDAERDGLVFLFVSSQGTAITQTQTGGDRDRMEMAAATFNGAATGFPPNFRTHIEFTAEDRYESGVWMNDDGEWSQVMSNRFRRVSAPE